MTAIAQPDMHMPNSYDPRSAAGVAAATADLLARRDRVLAPTYRLFYEHPFHPVRAEGVLVYDANGQEFLDAYNNVPVVGHSNPIVQEAIATALGRLNTHTRYLDEAIVGYAERLIQRFPASLSKAVFTCSGSEAVDLAVRIARSSTGRRGVIVTGNAYHGTTSTTVELSPALGVNNPLPKHVAAVTAPDMLRDEPGQMIKDFEHRIDVAAAALDEAGYGVAAIIVDSVMSTDGLQFPAQNALQVVRDRATTLGAMYIADEVQAGFGRTGSNWWGFQAHGVLPDLVALGKPMGNGYPLAGVVGTDDAFEAFGRDMRYFNTFGGSAAAAAAGTAVLDELEDRGLLPQADRLGKLLVKELDATIGADPRVSLRHAGMFIAVEFSHPDLTPDPGRARSTVNRLRESGVLISLSGPHENVLKVRPPLVFGDEHVDRLLTALIAAVSEAT